jgi:hypothetical protein
MVTGNIHNNDGRLHHWWLSFHMAAVSEWRNLDSKIYNVREIKQ